ncbi:MAG: MltA domain-containing protein [SAR324 cluster bacterium]|nr:MltA domain-containing protein [SAR324 cluster bacterium]
MKLFLSFLQISVIVIFGLHGCARKVVKDDVARSPFSSQNMYYNPETIRQVFAGDNMPINSLKESAKNSLAYFNKIPKNRNFKYGNTSYTAYEVAQSIQLFLKIVEDNPDQELLIDALEENFDLYGSSVNKDDGVMFTGYYEPIFSGSLKKTKTYNVPAYGKPDDLTVLNLGRFRQNLKKRTIVYRMEGQRIKPYYTRKQIMERKVLANKGLEVAWLKDPTDLFFLQVQGSGILVLPDGSRVKLSYNGANGRPYSSIGKLLVDENHMQLEEISMGSIRNYLKNNPRQKNRILYHNQSYTFFNLHKNPEGPRGVINVPLTPLRSVAVDVSRFPKGALAYIKTEVPSFDSNWVKTAVKPFAGFVMIQDTGGAIRGPGRVDVFWGNGELAENSAGVMRSHGQLYFFIAKKKVLEAVN